MRKKTGLSQIDYASVEARLVAHHDACSNCGSMEWAAKNDDYCTGCCDSYMEYFYRVFSRTHNPLQDYVDKIMNEVQGHDN